MEQPVQLTLGFGRELRPARLNLTLAGMQVLVDVDPAMEHAAWSHLHAVGAEPFMSDARGLSFPAGRLRALADLPEQVSVTADGTCATLLALVTHPSDGGTPAELTVDRSGVMWLAWFDGAVSWHEPIPAAAAAALVGIEVPFVATPDAFDTLSASCHLPILAGRAKVNLDRYIEIATSQPQLVESAPLPGLFRVDETHYGMALAYQDALRGASGFVWDGPQPDLDTGPRELPPMPMTLSAHAHADLRGLVDRLAARRAQAIVWDSGLGRRIFALAAVEALDAWPILVVCPPQSVWPWRRHLDLFARSSALTGDDADARIVTYHDLARGARIGTPQAVIVDDLTAPGVVSQNAMSALRRLGGIMDAYRLAVSTTWPTDPAGVIEAMSILRPGEFRADWPAVRRYPPDASRRLAEHADAYLSTRAVTDPGTVRGEFRRSSVVALRPTGAQQDEIREVLGRTDLSAQAVLAQCVEVLSAGTEFSLSPKVAAAARHVLRAAAEGRTVAVLTRSRRTVELLRASARVPGNVALDAAQVPPGGLSGVPAAFVRFDRDLPRLHNFDDVLFVDYPWSSDLIETCVGPIGAPVAPARVSILHLSGTLDDRLALLAAMRSETTSGAGIAAYPSEAEIAYLLDPRDN